MPRTTVRVHEVLVDDIRFTGHALKRFRERWPESASIGNVELKKLLNKQVKDAHQRGDYVNTPGGRLYPVSYLGMDGFAVLKGTTVTTITEESWYPEAIEIRKARGYG